MSQLNRDVIFFFFRRENIRGINPKFCADTLWLSLICIRQLVPGLTLSLSARIFPERSTASRVFDLPLITRVPYIPLFPSYFHPRSFYLSVPLVLYRRRFGTKRCRAKFAWRKSLITFLNAHERKWASVTRGKELDQGRKWCERETWILARSSLSHT